MATRISGIALMPRESRNGIFYDVEQLKKFDGVTVPLRVEHNQESNIGEVLFTFDPIKTQVRYTATVTDPLWQENLDREQYQVSIGASILDERELCDEMKVKCLNAPVLDEILELSIVKTPGIPESTLKVDENTTHTSNELIWTGTSAGGATVTTGSNIVIVGIPESTLKVDENISAGGGITWTDTINTLTTGTASNIVIIGKPDKIEKNCTHEGIVVINTSNKQTVENNDMVESTKDNSVETEKPKVEEKTTITIVTDGELDVKSTETKSASVPEKDAEATKEVAHDDDECPDGQKKVDGKCVKDKVDETKCEVVESKKEIVEAIQSLKESWKPKSEVSEASDQVFEDDQFTDETAKVFLDKLFETGYGVIKMDKEGWMQAHTIEGERSGNGYVTEAVTTSGTISGVKQQTNISIQLGAKTAIPIRQFGQFAAIPVGQNTARFYRITVPDAGAITESPTTDISAATHTLTAIDITCAIRGWRQVVEKAELEDFPASFLNTLRETARLEAIRDEHRLIVQDLGATDHDFGGTTTAPYHIGGSDGVATTTPTEEDADGELDEDGLTFAKRYLQELGQDVGPGKLIAFISPRAFEALSSSTSLSEYTQIGNPNITRLGQMERLYGIDIIVTNELLVANNADRNLICVKGKAWALASQRSMEIELQKQIAGQYWDIVWTHRIGVDILDPNTYIIVSTVA